jgi:hypothetical protein
MAGIVLLQVTNGILVDRKYDTELIFLEQPTTRAITLAVRGSASMADWGRNAKFWTTEDTTGAGTDGTEGGQGKVHAGFGQNFLTIAPTVYRTVDALFATGASPVPPRVGPLHQ